MTMSNRAYLNGPHRLLPGYAGLSASRSSLGPPPSSRASPPEFSYDAYPRSGSGGGGRDSSSYAARTPPNAAAAAAAATVAGNAAMGLYQNMGDFPYSLSGVQMPTYNFGSELYNYVSNGFPRKSRMCTYCNKVFTRSTTRRYHERRCPLLRASNSLAKSEDSNSAAAVAAVVAMKDQQHQRQKEALLSPSAAVSRSQSVNNHNSSMHSIPNPSSCSPTTPSLHPAYPTSYPPPSALTPSPSRAAPTYGNYANAYNAHYYGHTLSTAALAALDQNSNSLQSKKESDNTSWASSSPSPSSKQLDTSSSVLANASSLLKAFNPDANLDLTSRYCTDFSIRSQPSVFPPNSLRAPPASPPSPEPGETKTSSTHNDPSSPHDLSRPSKDKTDRNSNSPRDGKYIPEKAALSNGQDANPKTSSPPPILWNNKMRMERAREQYMSMHPADDEDDDDDDEEEDEGAVEEDEEQFNGLDGSQKGSSETEDENYGLKNGSHSPLPKNSKYNPLVCQYCQKSFSDITTRKAHEEMHAQTKSFACCICSHSFHCAFGLRIHFIRHHKQDSYTCKFCFKTHKDPLELKDHLISQHPLSKAEKHSLKLFSYLVKDYDKIPAHMMNSGLSDSEHESKNINSVIQRRSADNLKTASEEEKTTKLQPSRENGEVTSIGSVGNEETEVCKICNKAFAKSFIRIHERSHADQKPYECPMCHKRFGYKNNMKSHMKLHQGLKPYQCQICGARFTRGSTLRRHGRRHNISRNSMLDYVLYDHSAGPTRAAGVSSKPHPPPLTTSQAVAAVSSMVNSPYSPRLSSADHGIGKSLNFLQHHRTPLMPTSPGADRDRGRHNSTSGRSSAGSPSPRSIASPRTPSSHLSAQGLNTPSVGDLAAAAAANLFGYPTAVTAPQLYQFYASTNPLMNYSAYASNQNTATVQSDALNLSLGKRKSIIEEEGEVKNKISKREQDIISKEKENFHRSSLEMRENKYNIKTEEPGELVRYKNDTHNSFMPNFAVKKEFPSKELVNGDRHNSKEPLKFTTEDFGTQVNICCPVPIVQSTTGSSTCPDQHAHQWSHPSPSGLSNEGSPTNSASSVPSPTNTLEPREGQTLPDLLLPLLSSGKLFRCSHCDIYFTEYAMFRVHQKHHQIDTARPFMCSYCGEDCKEKNFFTLHISAHLKLVNT